MLKNHQGTPPAPSLREPAINPNRLQPFPTLVPSFPSSAGHLHLHNATFFLFPFHPPSTIHHPQSASIRPLAKLSTVPHRDIPKKKKKKGARAHERKVPRAKLALAKLVLQTARSYMPGWVGHSSGMQQPPCSRANSVYNDARMVHFLQYQYTRNTPYAVMSGRYIDVGPPPAPIPSCS